MSNRYHTFVAFLAWLAFIVYGSLLPFELRGISLDQAVETFSNIRFLDLGIVSRADWIANILLYIPLAFLGCSWIAGERGQILAKAFAIPTVLLICAGTAIGVEFIQTFYAPRTVSLNDLLAEGIGSGLGVLVWLLYGKRIRDLLDAFAQGGRASVYAAISFYAIAYILLAFFPYDFLISLDELKWKLSSDSLGWIFAGNCGSWVRCGAKQLGEVLAILPLGLLLALANRHLSLKRVFVLGAGLSLAIELIQLLLASGTSQGASLMLRAVGLTAGVRLGQLLQQHGVHRIANIIRRLTPLLALPYLVALVVLNSWFSGRWISPDAALERLADIRLLPFYYHYFSTETHAVASLLAQFTLYAPVGIALWARDVVRQRGEHGRLWLTGVTAALLSLPIELGKLFVPPQHPDLTNLLIAAFGAVSSYWLARWIGAAASGHAVLATDAQPTLSPPPEDETTLSRPPARPFGLLAGIIAISIAALGVALYPTQNLLLAAGLLGYAILLYRSPWLWLAAIPIALPLLDLSPLNGRLLLDGFDLLILTTLAMGYWRIYPLRPQSWPRRTLALTVSLLWLSWTVAFAHGIWPLLDTPASIIASSHTPLEAWYVGKGLLWALLLVPLLRRVPKEKYQQAQTLFLRGIVIGLALEVMMVLWERQVFVGLTDFSNIFRVTGTFASMHTGGAYIEAYLAFAFPVLVVWILRQHRWSRRIPGLLLVAATAYAMSVTYSRGGYAGLVASLLVVATGVAIQRRGAIPSGKVALAGAVLGVIAIGLPVVSGEFAQSRLQRSMEDLQIRLAHWQQAVSIMDDGPLTALTGMGFGRYPTQYLYRIGAEKGLPGIFSVLQKDKDTFLQLTPGEALYLEQVIRIEPGASYTLSVRMRQPAGRTTLSVPLCEKALLYSFGCNWTRFTPKNADSTWQVLQATLSNDLGRDAGWLPRPVKLSLYNSGSKNPVDVDWISLKDGNGKELLENGGFDDGAKHWLFVTDRDLAWHIHQQEVETYFAQGILGLLALLILVLATGRILRRGILSGCTFSLAIAGALAGFLTVGLLGSTVDTARLSMLFYFGALSGALLADKGRRKRRLTVREK